MRARDVILVGAVVIGLLLGGCSLGGATGPKPQASTEATTTRAAFPEDGIPAAKTTWKGHFGSDHDHPETAYTLVALGFFQAVDDDVDTVVSQWLAAHPDARVIEAADYGEPAPDGTVLKWAWIVDGTESLNHELVRQGMCPADAMRWPDEPGLLVTTAQYDAFAEPLARLGQEAEEHRLGVYESNDD